MNIRRRINVENVCIFLFIVYLGCLQYHDQSVLVGFGFLFILIMSFLTTNKVICLIGSFVMINIIARTTTTVTERFEERCEHTCFAMTTNYEQKIMDMEEKESIMKNKIIALETDIALDKSRSAMKKSSSKNLKSENTKLLKIVNQTHALSQ